MQKVQVRCVYAPKKLFNKLVWLMAVGAGVQAVQAASYTPNQITQAYSLNGVKYSGGVTANGAGQTIAIIDWYNDPNIANEAKSFDTAYGIQQLNNGGPTLTVVNETGGSTLPSTVTGSAETALDVEYVHAMAPQANILLVEPNSANFSDTDTAVNYAKAVPGVSVISMSYGAQDGTGLNYSSYDSTFTQASGHSGVTFVASTGDSQTPSYPSTSSHVVALGGSTLSLNGSNNRSNETLWSSGEGTGYSGWDTRPTFQNAVSNATYRSVPDLSMDANPSSGVDVYFSESTGATPSLVTGVGGTSVAAPLFSGLMADADQGRAINGLPALTSDQTLTDIYATYGTSQYSSDFYDITSGSSNSYSAGSGFDVASGLGAPIASGLLPYLATVGAPVPEPTMLAMLIVPAALLTRRRRNVR